MVKENGKRKGRETEVGGSENKRRNMKEEINGKKKKRIIKLPSL